MKRKKQIEEVSSFVKDNISRRKFIKKNIDIVSLLALGSLFFLTNCKENELIEVKCNSPFCTANSPIYECNNGVVICYPSIQIACGPTSSFCINTIHAGGLAH